MSEAFSAFFSLCRIMRFGVVCEELGFKFNYEVTSKYMYLLHLIYMDLCLMHALYDVSLFLLARYVCIVHYDYNRLII
jgi:hypothetical protein